MNICSLYLYRKTKNKKGGVESCQEEIEQDRMDGVR